MSTVISDTIAVFLSL